MLKNRGKLVRKGKYRYHNGNGKEKAVEYYQSNQEVLRKNAKNKYWSLSGGKKEIKKSIWKK